MKRRKTQQTLRAESRGLRKVQNEQNVWTFIQGDDVLHQWGTFSGSTTFAVNDALSVGDIITINASDTTSCAFGLDLAYKNINPKRVHPARRRKVIQDQKDMMDDQMVVVSGGTSLTCTKIDNVTWVVNGVVS
ncbi:MAG: hypothetical protein ACTSPB_24505 [Candidatus Thorarchaeota archaeon]